MDLKDQYVLITGASSGIGRELAQSLSGDHRLILCGRNSINLEQTKTMCANPKSQLIWVMDLEQTDAIEDALKQFIGDNNVAISHFVHCAGLMKMVPCKMLQDTHFLETYKINVISAAMIIKTLTAKRINGEALKSVVLISSNISNFGAKTFSAYASSKAALDGLMRCFAVELAPRVRVNSVLPGGIETKMTQEIYQDAQVKDRMNERYPLGKGNAKNISDAVKFLISEQSSWITGQQITVDGGRTINLTE